MRLFLQILSFLQLLVMQPVPMFLLSHSGKLSECPTTVLKDQPEQRDTDHPAPL
jgi:hypothetical protein